MIEIPWQSLDGLTLESLLQEIVSRDGTDYGVAEIPVEVRCRQALQSLQQGRAVLVWDEDSASASLVERSRRIPSD